MTYEVKGIASLFQFRVQGSIALPQVLRCASCGNPVVSGQRHWCPVRLSTTGPKL